MAKKESPVNSNVNTHNITNNVQVDVHQPKRTYTKRKQKTNWFAKAIIGGIVTIITALIIYYNTGTNQTHKPPGADNHSNAISGIKQ